MKSFVGKKFGRLLVLEMTQFKPGKYYVYRAICLCDCGNTTEPRLYDLKRGATKSCGCLEAESRVRHGRWSTPLYRRWASMLQRCNNTKNPEYKNYGGRGISVCQEWHNFPCFMEWALGAGYAPSLTIDRIDNNLGYGPENCRWVTQKTNNNNKRTCKTFKFFGELLTVSQASEKFGIDRGTLQHRIFRKRWSPEDAVTRPVRNY